MVDAGGWEDDCVHDCCNHRHLCYHLENDDDHHHFHDLIEVVDAGDWESDANERIDRLRKRDVNVEVNWVVMVMMMMMNM